ncbi:DNA modification methylase [Methylobacterium sp. PvR107]|uniref:DNA modification methylase n=1 Tax=Methylobacterium sp. PvR107 TaxID=2806597 RepID=UPI001AE53A98|nr:DNA modification methylase [Methylobacterium sp. PvR107]MBP1178445.1 DNA modification methylase [Methylobacterium sp. PvR107]
MPASTSKLAALTARSNALPLDSAPRIALGPGIEARYGLCPCSTLKANPAAVRVHPKQQIKKLARAIEVAGPLTPVVVDEGYTILSGHARVEAVRAGSESIPIVQVFGLSEAQKSAFLLSDNRIGEDARLDRQRLAKQIPELTILFQEAGFEISDTGFEIAELDALTLDFADQIGADDDIDPALLQEPLVLRPGDLLQLGEHRLAVGDARDTSLLDRLLAGVAVECAFLDVPYNLAQAELSTRGKVRHPDFAFASGEMSPTEYVAFLSAALGNAARVSAPGAVHFACIDWRHVQDLLAAGSSVYGAYLNLVVWNKTNAGQGGLYRNQHELIAVFRVGEARHRDNVQMGRYGRNRSNVWAYPGANGFGAGRLANLAAHPTVKPLQLVADALKDVTRSGAVVLDTFVGSGTTILAGEQVGRRVRAVEIEPRYAQVAIRRWERMTGRTAVCAETGESLDDWLHARTRRVDRTPHDACALVGSTEVSGPAAASASEEAPSAAPPPRIRIRTRVP